MSVYNFHLQVALAALPLTAGRLRQPNAESGDARETLREGLCRTDSSHPPEKDKGALSRAATQNGEPLLQPKRPV